MKRRPARAAPRMSPIVRTLPVGRVGVDLPDRFPDGWGGRERRDVRAYHQVGVVQEQREHVLRYLRDGQVESAQRFLFEREVLDPADDTHDLGLAGPLFGVLQAEPRADGVAAGEELAGEDLVDDRDARPAGVVANRQRPAPDGPGYREGRDEVAGVDPAALRSPGPRTACRSAGRRRRSPGGRSFRREAGPKRRPRPRRREARAVLRPLSRRTGPRSRRRDTPPFRA